MAYFLHHGLGVKWINSLWIFHQGLHLLKSCGWTLHITLHNLKVAWHSKRFPPMGPSWEFLFYSKFRDIHTLTNAPASSKTRTALSCPLLAASIRAVTPSMSVLFTCNVARSKRFDPIHVCIVHQQRGLGQRVYHNILLQHLHSCSGWSVPSPQFPPSVLVLQAQHSTSDLS